MSRIESGREKLHNVQFSLSDMLEQINAQVNLQCGKKGLEYECHILNELDETYVGDDKR